MSDFVICLFALVSTTFGTDSPLNLEISVAEAVKPFIRYGDILFISNLKRQQNESLQHIVNCMDNSFGIVMNPMSRTRRKRQEMRLEWIVDRRIKAGIKLKYLNKAFPSIYIHFFAYERDWWYIDDIMRALIIQNNGHNIILNQIDALNNYNVNSDDLAFPICTVFFRVYRGDWSDTAEVIDFLKNEFNALSPCMFAEVSGKLISCKKIHKIRKKVLPLLSLLYKERKSMIYNESVPYDQAMQSIQSMLTDPKTQKEYGAFFIAMKKVIETVAMDKMRTILHISKQREALLITKIRASDLMKAYRNMTMSDLNGDVHVLCRVSGYWDFASVHETLVMILDKAEFGHKMANVIAKAIVKTVPHPEVSNSTADISHPC